MFSPFCEKELIIVTHYFKRHDKGKIRFYMYKKSFFKSNWLLRFLSFLATSISIYDMRLFAIIYGGSLLNDKFRSGGGQDFVRNFEFLVRGE